MNRQRITVAAVAFVLAAVPAAALLSAGSASAQDAPIAEVFQKKCLSCHGPDSTVPPNLRGPSIKGIVGKGIAATKGYEYSPGLKAHAKEKWTPATLDTYLTKPKDFAEGSKMVSSVADPAQRKALIEHMKSYK